MVPKRFSEAAPRQGLFGGGGGHLKVRRTVRLWAVPFHCRACLPEASLAGWGAERTVGPCVCGAERRVGPCMCRRGRAFAQVQGVSFSLLPPLL